MGMYDNVRCEAPVPDPEAQDLLFQSKDLDCMLGDYTITKDGRLIHHTTKLEAVPEHEQPYYGKPEWGDENSFYRLVGMVRSVPTGDVELKYHGDVDFYVSVGDYGTLAYRSYDYVARFNEGKLQWIRRAQDRDMSIYEGK